MTDAPQWVPVLILFGLLGLAYVGMWRGWRRRGRRHDLPPLVPPVPSVPSDASAPSASASQVAAAAGGGPVGPGGAVVADGRYFGTTVAGDWLDRVVTHGLGARSSCRLVVSTDGVDVHRPRAGFRIPRSALVGARLESGIAGKVVPPHGILVVTWQHGDLQLDSGFRLDSLTGGEADAVVPRDVHAAVETRISDLVARP